MFNMLQTLEIETEHVKLCDMRFTKRMHTYDIMKGHIVNFVFCIGLSIRSDYFIPLASNCMFHRPVSMDILRLKLAEAASFDTLTPDPSKNYSNWQWPKFFRNKKITQIMTDHGILNYNGGQHEGCVYSYEAMQFIVDFIVINRIEESIEHDAIFEEILFATLYSHFTKKMPYSLCKVFWSAPQYTPTIRQITETEEPCVKRVDRDYNNLIRTWLRERAGKYV